MGISAKHFAVRQHLFEDGLSRRVPFGSFVHPSAYVDPSRRWGWFPSCCPASALGPQCNDRGKSVRYRIPPSPSHDSAVQNHTFLSPQVAIAGFTTAAANVCNIGINTTIIDNVSLPPRIQTGGGAVVCHSLVEPGYTGCARQTHQRRKDYFQQTLPFPARRREYIKTAVDNLQLSGDGMFYPLNAMPF